MRVLKLYPILVFLLYCQLGYSTQWMTSLDEAKKLSILTKKPIIIDFWATWCGPCLLMDRDTWSQNEVKKLMEFYIPVKLDIDVEHSYSRAYGIGSIPDIYIVDANDKILHRASGYKSKNEMLSILKKYALDMTYFNMEIVNYYKSDNYINAFRLGAKYADFALYINDDLVYDVSRVSKEYLNEAKSELEKSDDKNTKQLMNDRIALYEIQILLSRGKLRQVSKELNNINTDQLTEANLDMYNFINYLYYIEDSDIVNTDKFKEMLTDSYLKKANYYLKTKS